MSDTATGSRGSRDGHTRDAAASTPRTTATPSWIQASATPLQIAAVSAPGEGDQFLYYASRAEVSQAAMTPGRRFLRIDMLVFATSLISSDELTKPHPEQP